MTRRFTGWHMAAILVGFFGVVIAVNLVMARFAVSTFGGVVVENSYVASQHFNRWLDSAEAQDALGWDARLARTGQGKVAVTLTGAPAEVTVEAVARHPLGRQPDVPLGFTSLGDGRFVSNEALPAGRWTLRLAVALDAQVWRRDLALP
jgi:nitrogen fixation protein FixH